MKSQFRWRDIPFALLALLILLFSCETDPDLPPDEEPGLPSGTSYIEPEEQRSGNVSAGRDYLIYGDYVKSGIPYDAYILAAETSTSNYLGRTGDNEIIPYYFSAVDAPNGVRVVSANCLQCHAQKLNGEFVMGLGNSTFDFTYDRSLSIALSDAAIAGLYGMSSPEWEAYASFRRGALTTGPELITEVVGVNSADKLSAVLSAHRDRNDLSWSDSPMHSIPGEVIPTDVPAWWILKKKHALLYTAAGRGDFAKIMTASSLLTMEGIDEADDINSHFNDVLAYIFSLEPPEYPQSIEFTMAEEGKVIFESNCSKCHGTYGSDVTYPNLLVDLDEIGTDAKLAETNWAYPELEDWYNNSWFAMGPDEARLESGAGYVAPPLDGIWATAPYLHNGSVPTLEDMLNSAQRPTYWKRSFATDDYDYDMVGWNYSEEPGKTDKYTYDTTIPGYGNDGHTYGDVLSASERAAVIEYLKTL